MTRKGYRRFKKIWSGILAGEKDLEREWLVEPEKLIDLFRGTRNLFVTSRVCCIFHGCVTVVTIIFRQILSEGCFLDIANVEKSVAYHKILSSTVRISIVAYRQLDYCRWNFLTVDFLVHWQFFRHISGSFPRGF